LDHRVAVLSFVDLIELMTGLALRDRGLSLQQVRAAASLARQTFRAEHPFASRFLFTDGKAIFASTGPSLRDDAVIELSKDRDAQLQFTRVIEPLVAGLEFDPASGLARRWWPTGPNGAIVIDPDVCAGLPVVAGTRVQTELAAGVARADSVVAAARYFGLTEPQVESAVRFEER
jgi:uncharacterized protein (DUF433 family)